jgi:hypothetical protein
MTHSDHEEALRERSGDCATQDPLVALLYELLQEHVHPSDMEELVRNALTEEPAILTNGWIGRYADDIAMRLSDARAKFGYPKGTVVSDGRETSGTESAE